MKVKAFVLIVVAAGLWSAAWAGDIEGKVTGMKGHSVVYVEGISGKTFPAPKEHPVMDQKGLVFAPHIMVVQQGTAVDFLNSDSVQHNVFRSAGKTFPAPKEHPVMDQKGLVFAPHIMVVQQGTAVDFLNSDSVQHNVF